MFTIPSTTDILVKLYELEPVVFDILIPVAEVAATPDITKLPLVLYVCKPPNKSTPNWLDNLMLAEPLTKFDIVKENDTV